MSAGYRTPFTKLSVRKIHLQPGLRVTWVKLILGRWCIVAASDVNQRRLSIWEIVSDGIESRMADVFLEAPVIYGQIDHSAGRVRCAITVGTM